MCDQSLSNLSLRNRCIDIVNRRILVTNFRGSKQEKDFTRPPNCSGFGRVRHFRRHHSVGWPADPLPMDPWTRKMGLPQVDVVEAQLFQASFCNWRCWYCYVPSALLCADVRHAAWLTTGELLDMCLQEEHVSSIIDLSGGQPDLAPEWVPWMMSELRARGLENRFYIWSDDNLSTDYFWRYLSNDDIRLVREYRAYGKVCCFKGFDSASFSFNTGASPELYTQQFSHFRRLLSLDIDLYAYATFTSFDERNIAERMMRFVDQLQALRQYLPLRLVPLEIVSFAAMQHRIGREHEKAMKVQWAAIECWKYELRKRFPAEMLERTICDVPL